MTGSPPPPRPGTYALVLYLPSEITLMVGRLGSFNFAPGYYVYVGSARGPGGLAARIARHAREKSVIRWHIDHLRPYTQWCAVWWAESSQRLDCEWAQALGALHGVTVPIPGFGASDCRCISHLLAFPAKPDAMQATRLPGTVHTAIGFDAILREKRTL